MIRTFNAAVAGASTTTRRSVVLASPTSPQARRSEIVSSWRIFITACRLACGASVLPEGDLERLDIQMRLGQQLLQLRVLRLELAQALGFRYLHSAELRPPTVERRIAETVLTTQVFTATPASASFKNPMICCSVIAASSRPALLSETDFTNFPVVSSKGCRSHDQGTCAGTRLSE